MGVCPLDGGQAYTPDPPLDRYLVCATCSEILGAEELVKRATWRTRRAYRARNPETEQPVKHA